MGQRGNDLAPGQLVDRSRPILFQQSRQRAIGEQLAIGLTTRAVVGLVVGVADPLHRSSTDGTRLPELSVNGHLFAKRSHFRREVISGLLAQSLGPLDEYLLRRLEQRSDFC